MLIDKMSYLAEHTAHEVVLMTVWHDKKPLAFPLSEKVRRIKLNVPLPSIPGGYALTLPLAYWRFNKYVKKISPDVALFFRAVGAFLIVTTPWKGKKVFESHSALAYMNHKWIYKHMESKVDRIVCLTNGNKREFECKEKAVVIPNFTMVKPFSIPDYSSKHCIWAGRLERMKNPERLVKVWSEIHKRQPEWQLDMYGDGPLRECVKKLIHKLHLQDTIILHGQTDSITEKYAQGSILLMTSRSEGLPMVLIEAATCALPLVAFDCPYGPSDVIRHGENGMLIDYNDDNAMINAVCELMDSEERRRKMGQKAKELARCYQPASIAAQWIKLFAELSAQPSLHLNE